MIFDMPKIYSKGIDFTLDQISLRVEPRKILMASPEYFDVIDVKNPYMEGHAGKINKKRAKDQWNELKAIYQKLIKEGRLDEVMVINGVEGCEDMVFAANQSFPWVLPSGEKVVIMSKMRHASREKEVPYFEKFYAKEGYRTIHLKKTSFFEGMGDTIPHPGRNLIYGGYGHRSDKQAYEELSELLNVPVVVLELINENFYHLDTCFVPLDEKTVMLYPGAFTKEGLTMIKALFQKVIQIPMNEAVANFALNAHVVPGRYKEVILQKGSEITTEALLKEGFNVFETDTSEFMKSGGSVFCMKMMYY